MLEFAPFLKNLKFIEAKMNLKNENISKLSNFPIMFFAVTMGLGGLSIAYRAISEAYGAPHFIFEILRFFALGVFALISAFYTAKIIKFPRAVQAEFTHPIKLSFFATFSISLLLLAIAFNDISALHSVFYGVAMIFHAFLTLYIISFWIQKNMLITHSNPAWFIPIVGNLIVVIAASEKGEYLWYFFSIGIFFWIVLFSIVFYRIIFHDQLAQKFVPTLFIMIAPPSVAFLGYINIGGEFDMLAKILINLVLFFTLLIFFMAKSFFGLKFFLSWWAFTFPTAAGCIAFMKAYFLSAEVWFARLGLGMFALLCVLICIVSYHTIKGLINGEICVQE
ncbi:SLAC1 anion channel family protein [Campylobacter sp. JMF_02 ED1]|uniref:SLAC1 anion channel family protein n=2 Tax=Campylobacter TaxID=194 RepID=UPI0022E9BF56|nr:MULTISPECIES: SLAC1 anion channel family protein [unclassified Campylobacter]MDA3049331.1 SLAC1 anion channel family protein [Campylobacter sp. JMF_15 NE4]MDA3051244.1 SLAC1 anion channel family protein [Campylobacter sp. JMF_02 ED1]